MNGRRLVVSGRGGGRSVAASLLGLAMADSLLGPILVGNLQEQDAAAVARGAAPHALVPAEAVPGVPANRQARRAAARAEARARKRAEALAIADAHAKRKWGVYGAR